MKTLTWDSINPLTGKKFAWDDPNLRWGDPSYYLEPGDPGFVPYGPAAVKPRPKKKKTFRRKAQAPTQLNTYPDPTMATFKYNVAPNPNGGFTTRPVIGDPISDDAFLTRAAELSGSLTAEQIGTAIDAVVATITECGGGCHHSTGLRGKLRFRPTSGGSQAAPGDFDNPDEINADIALSLTAEVRDAWRTTLTLESMGEVGKISPEISAILSQENGQPGKYTPGTMIELSGNNLRFDRTDLTQGVFFRSGNDPEVRATVYGTVVPSSLSVLVPATLSGPLTVRAAAYINGSVRSFTYMDPITEI